MHSLWMRRYLFSERVIPFQSPSNSQSGCCKGRMNASNSVGDARTKEMNLCFIIWIMPLQTGAAEAVVRWARKQGCFLYCHSTCSGCE